MLKELAVTLCASICTLHLLTGAYCSSVERSDHWRVKRSDVNTELQTTVERQAALLLSLQAEVTALKTRLQVTSTQVAFFVRFTADPGPTDGIHLSHHLALKFDDVITNIGNAYDPAIGMFTAPVPGLYAFFLSAMSVNTKSMIELAIVKQGVVLDYTLAEGNSDNFDQGSTQVTTHLKAGEQVWVQEEHGDVVRGGPWTVFNGYLLQAD